MSRVRPIISRLAGRVLAAAVILATCAGSAAASEPTSRLSAAAQTALDTGLRAAEQRDWPSALRAFDRARTAAPDSPIPLYNLGLAEAQVPGRELRSIAWFEAYLALAPDAANGADVRRQIAALDVGAKGHARTMLEALTATAAKFSEGSKVDELGTLARLLVDIGDLDAALATLDQIGGEPQLSVFYREGVRADIVEALARNGRFAEAVGQAGQISHFGSFQPAYTAIVSAQIKAGLFAEARRSIGVLSAHAEAGSPAAHGLPLALDLAVAEYAAGRKAEAQGLMDEARSFIAALPAASNGGLRAQFAVAQYKTGDPEAAKALLRQIRAEMGPLASAGPNPAAGRTIGGKYGDRMRGLEDLGRAWNEIGDRKQALRTLDEAYDALRAGEKTEIIPLVISDAYIAMHDWDGAGAVARREVSDPAFDFTAQEKNGSWIGQWDEQIAAARTEVANESAKAAALAAIADPQATRLKRAQAWSAYIDATMNKPIFTDFSATLEAIASSPPRKRHHLKESSFTDLKEQAELYVGRLRDIGGLVSAAAAPGS